MFIRFAHEKIKVPMELFDQWVESLWERLFGDGGDGARAAAAHDVEAVGREKDAAKEMAAREDVREMLRERRYQLRKAIFLTYASWGICAWMIFVCACPASPSPLRNHNPLRLPCSSQADPPSPSPAPADGMLIYKLLGEGAEVAFVKSWGTAFGIDSAKVCAGPCLLGARVVSMDSGQFHRALTFRFLSRAGAAAPSRGSRTFSRRQPRRR